MNCMCVEYISTGRMYTVVPAEPHWCWCQAVDEPESHSLSCGPQRQSGWESQGRGDCTWWTASVSEDTSEYWNPLDNLSLPVFLIYTLTSHRQSVGYSQTWDLYGDRPCRPYILHVLSLSCRERENIGEELAASLAGQTPDNGIKIHVATRIFMFA